VDASGTSDRNPDDSAKARHLRPKDGRQVRADHQGSTSATAYPGAEGTRQIAHGQDSQESVGRRRRTRPAAGWLTGRAPAENQLFTCPNGFVLTPWELGAIIGHERSVPGPQQDRAIVASSMISPCRLVLPGLTILALVWPGTAAAEPVTTINGSPPPGVLQPLDDVTTMIDTVNSDGNRLLVVQGTRKAGTRAAIHLHAYGGYTCVLSGVITDFIEGQPPMTFPAGTCYYMPPDVPMTAVNLGTGDARLIDNFALPPGIAPMTVLESGWTTPIPVP
jgi:quercetin dioxygenase-like cupin family protein